MRRVRVFCPICKGGKNTIWKGTLHEWGQELEKVEPPEWAKYAHRHETHHGHQIMVKYPGNIDIPLKEADS